MVSNSNIISINPEISFGKPCISGTLICVTDVLHLLTTGMTNAEIITDHPILTEEYIFSALVFSANREANID